MAKKKETDLESEKSKSLEMALSNIRKSYGEGAIMKLGENRKLDVKAISTGSIGIDIALGIGGVPRGRIVEIYGAESSGKTTIALHIIAEAQKKGGLAAFIDAEHALDPIYAKALGVNIDELLISQPDTGEQALEIADHLVRSGALDVVIVDSVAALVPKQEIEGEMGDQQMGLQARLMSKGLRKITGSVSKSDTVLVFINQIREKIGGFSFTPGVQTTTSGGRALKFFSSVRMEIKRVGSIKQGDEVIGNETLAKITKNKVAPEREICRKSGAWFSFGDERLGQGKVNVEKMLAENKELFEEIEAKVLESIKAEQKASVTVEDTVIEDENTENTEE